MPQTYNFLTCLRRKLYTYLSLLWLIVVSYVVRSSRICQSLILVQYFQNNIIDITTETLFNSIMKITATCLTY